MAKFAISQGLKKAFVFYGSNNEYSANLGRSFEEVFTSLGGQIVGKESYPATMSDFSDLLDRVKSSQAEVLFLPDFYPTINLIGRQAKTHGRPGCANGRRRLGLSGFGSRCRGRRLLYQPF